MIRKCSRLPVFLLSAAAAAGAPAAAQHGAVGGEWREYGGDAGGTKYAPLGQIHPGNVGDLAIRWRWESPDNAIADPDAGLDNVAFESTPLMKDGVLYTSTSFSQAAAIDASTGEELWVHDPRSYDSGRPPNNGFLHRGLAWWTDGRTENVYLATGDARLIALDPATGTPRRNFGDAGTVDLKAGIRSLNNRSDQYGHSSPPTVVGDVLVIGSSVMDWAPEPEWPPGNVRGYDARTGRLLWTFHTVPRPGQFGYSTWHNGSAERVGGANVWAPMTADLELGYVYLPVSAPSNHFYGGHRKGDNLFANSLVCLDARTGRRVWHYQIVHHDIWDFDLPAPPNLVDITVDGKEIPAVALVTKQGWIFVFDRRTGKPVWPIHEVPVPQSQAPGERTALTQPRPTKPPPFDRQGIARNELNDGAEEVLADLDWGPIYTPPSTRGAVISPGLGGGANWGGAAFDPTKSRLYVPVLGVVPFQIRLYRTAIPDYLLYETAILSAPGNRYLLKPPWGHITAYDLDRGEILWQRANDGFNGYAGTASVLATQELLFYANRSRPVLTVLDAANGDVLRTIPLPGRASGVPMSYTASGRQHVVVAVGAGSEDAELVALSLAGELPEQHPGTLGFPATTAAVRESDGEVTLSVVRAGGSDGAVAAFVRTAGGSATAGADYEPVARTLAWAHGDSASRTFTLRLLDDGTGEGRETIELELDDPLGGASLGERRMVVTVEEEADTPAEPIEECVADATTLCLNGDRFRARVRYATDKGETGLGHGVLLTGDTGYFSFFDASNVEIVVKVLDGCEANGKYWLYATGLTDLDVELEVADPVTQTRHAYTSPPGEAFPPVADTKAFACR